MLMKDCGSPRLFFAADESALLWWQFGHILRHFNACGIELEKFYLFVAAFGA